MKHKNYPHMFHAVDWMPTLMEMLSCKLPKDHLPLDGVSHMKTILGMTDRAPREEMLLDIDPVIEKTASDARDFSYLKKSGFDSRMRAALRYKEWKIITGPPCSGTKCGVQSENRNYYKAEEYVSKSRSVRLYNITADPRESYDLSDKYPEVTKALLLKLSVYHEEQSLFMDRMRDKKARPETSEHTWFPWRESEVNDEAHQDYLIRVLAD